MLIKNCNLLFPRPPKRTHKLQEKPSALKKTSSTSKHENSVLFFYFFCHFCPPGSRIPDPATQINADPYGSGYGSGSATLSLGLRKDVQATKEDFSPQKRTSCSSKHEMSYIFYIFVGLFSGGSDPDPYSGSRFRIWIQIPNLDPDTDPLI